MQVPCRKPRYKTCFVLYAVPFLMWESALIPRPLFNSFIKCYTNTVFARFSCVYVFSFLKLLVVFSL